MSCADDLRRAVAEATPRLRALGAASATRPSPGRWSPREILGHLIDSAANNHQRFVRAQFQDDLVFPGYAQDDWVVAGRYAEAAWEDLVSLWRLYNLQLARVIEGAAPDARTRPRARHNLDQIGFRPFSAQTAVTLDDLMDDYVAHLAHHLVQIVGLEPSSERCGP